MWRVHHAQCPDPKGRVVFRIERTRRLDRDSEMTPEVGAGAKTKDEIDSGPSEDGLKQLRIEVESVEGHCTSRMKPGHHFTLRGGRLYIPPGRHFCLYALQAALPLLPAKQRALQKNDWLREDRRVLCPDPAGNVILRIDPME